MRSVTYPVDDVHQAGLRMASGDGDDIWRGQMEGSDVLLLPVSVRCALLRWLPISIVEKKSRLQ